MLLEARQKVLERYAEYLGRCDPTTIPCSSFPPGHTCHEALKTNWEALDNAATKGTKHRLLHSRERCAYCQVAARAHLDHFLPRSSFPEFSILTANLVPACERCNRKKLDAVGPSFCFHPLINSVWGVECPVEFEAQYTNDSLIFRVTPKSTVLVPGWVNAFQLLELEDLYIAEATTLLAENHYIYAQQWHEGGSEAIQSFLELQMSSYSMSHYSGHWKVAVVRSLKQCDRFCQGALFVGR